MRTKQILRDLKKAKNYLNSFIDNSQGKESNCCVKDLEDSELYLRTWVLPYIIDSINEIIRCKK